MILSNFPSSFDSSLSPVSKSKIREFVFGGPFGDHGLLGESSVFLHGLAPRCFSGLLLFSAIFPCYYCLYTSYSSGGVTATTGFREDPWPNLLDICSKASSSLFSSGGSSATSITKAFLLTFSIKLLNYLALCCLSIFLFALSSFG